MKCFISFLLLTFSLNSLASSDLLHFMESLKEKYNLPGVGVAQLKDGRLNLLKVSGIKSIESRFHLGSQTKAMTAMLIARLVDQKKLSYQATLVELFPDLTVHPENKKTTIEMLLLHRSGMARGIPDFEKIKDDLNRAQNVMEARGIAIKHLLSLRPEFLPDTKDVYSNSGYMVLGHLLERIHGKPFEEIIQRELFTPLSMSSCSFRERPDDPIGHIVKKGVLTAYPGDNLVIWAPAGSARCTLKDWSKFIQLQLNLMAKRDDLYSSAKSGMNYTLAALFKDSRGWFKEKAFTHTGTNLTNYARVWIFPETKRAILLATNRGGDESFSGNDNVLKETNDALSELAEFVYLNE